MDHRLAPAHATSIVVFFVSALRVGVLRLAEVVPCRVYDIVAAAVGGVLLFA